MADTLDLGSSASAWGFNSPPSHHQEQGISMQVEMEDISPVEKKLTVIIPAERVQDEVEEVYAEIGKSVRIKGFRPGKVPRPHLERLFGDEVKNRVGSKLIQDTFQTALDRKQLKPVSEPAAEPSPVEPGRDFTYTLRVEVMPPFEARDYQGLEVEQEVYEVKEAAVDAALEQMREQQATLRDPEPARGAEPGDVLVVDLSAKHEGKPLAGERGKGLRFILGKETGIPDLDRHLAGAKPGETRAFEVRYPQEDSRPELAGKTIAYTVALKELKERVLPALDDEFAKDQGNCSNLDELRAKTRTGLESYNAERSRRKLEQAMLDRLVEKNPMEVPPSLAHRRAEEMARSALMFMRQRQASEEVLHQLAEKFEDQAKKEVKAAYLIEAIGRQENLTAGEAEIQKKIEELAGRQQVHPDKLKDRLSGAEEQKRLQSQVVEDRVLAFLLERAKIKMKQVSAEESAEVK